MTPKTICFAAVLVLSAAAASAIDFGAHLGYYDNDVKMGYQGVNLMVPLGMVVIAPSVDYWKEHGAGYWLGGADVDLPASIDSAGVVERFPVVFIKRRV